MNKNTKSIQCSLCGKKILKNPNNGDKPYWVMRKLYPDRPPICDVCIFEMAILLEEQQNMDFIKRIDTMGEILLKRDEKITHTYDKMEKISTIVLECTEIVKNQDRALESIIRTIKHNSTTTNKYTKSNIMLIGSTGTGKTLIANTVANALSLPYVIVNATEYTEAGYYGKDVEDMIEQLYNVANGNLDKAQKGIIFIDEIDKKNSFSGEGRDVSGGKVIEALLTMLQGAKVTLYSNEVTIDTSFITFVVMGAFEDLKNVRDKRLNKKPSIGFGSDDSSKLLEQAQIYTAEDVEKVGFNSQFTARFPSIIELNEHTHDSLIDILSNSKASGVTPWREHLKTFNVKLEVTDEFLEEVVKRAIVLKVGARGISRIINEMMLFISNDVKEANIKYKTCFIDKETLDNYSSYKII